MPTTLRCEVLTFSDSVSSKISFLTTVKYLLIMLFCITPGLYTFLTFEHGELGRNLAPSQM